MDWVTTSAILDRLTDFNDRAMWDRFDARFRRPIVAFGRKLGLSQAAAEDAAQETMLAFARAYREGKYDRTQGKLRSWLFGIAYRQVASARRSRGQARMVQMESNEAGSPWGNVADEHQASAAWEVEWERETLEACTERVQEEVAKKTYRAFEMVVREDRAPADVAEELGMSMDAVYVSKHRVLKRLAELASEYEDTQPPAH